MTSRPALALPPEMAQQVARQAEMERAGRQLLERLACQIYVQLAATTILADDDDNLGEPLETILQTRAQQALQAALPMAAALGWHFQAAPPAGPQDQASERPI
jgi:hypothetical protein